MRSRMPVLAAGALAAVIAFGANPATSADPLQELNGFFVADADPMMVTLLADAPPELAGSDAMILFGEKPFSGTPVAAAPLGAGPNLLHAPNMGPGWYTAVGPFVAQAGNFDELPLEN